MTHLRPPAFLPLILGLLLPLPLPAAEQVATVANSAELRSAAILRLQDRIQTISATRDYILTQEDSSNTKTFLKQLADEEATLKDRIKTLESLPPPTKLPEHLKPDTKNLHESPAVADVALDTKIEEIEAHNQALEKVFNFLKEKSSANLVVNWKALEGAGIDRNTPITLHLSKISTSKVLSAVCKQLNHDGAGIDFESDGEIITVSTKDDLRLNHPRTVVVYNVRDLLPANPAAKTESSESTQLLVNLIKSHIQPEKWQDAGGGSRSDMSGYRGLLTVSTTHSIHLEIRDYLAKLREADKQIPATTSPSKSPPK